MQIINGFHPFNCVNHGVSVRKFATPKTSLRQGNLFVSEIEAQVPQDSIIHGLRSFLESYDWNNWIEENYKNTSIGRPCIHPKYLVGLLLFGLLENIRSTRALEKATYTRIELLYFLDRIKIDHTTISKFRNSNKEKLDALNRKIVEELLEKDANSLRCLVSDGTRIRANNGIWNRKTAEKIGSLKEEVLKELEHRQQEIDTIFAMEEKLATLEHDYESQLSEQSEQAKQELKRLRQKHEREKKQTERQLRLLKQKYERLQKALDKANKNDAKRRSKHGVSKATSARVALADPDSNVLVGKEGVVAPNYTPLVTVEAATGAIIHHAVAENSEEAFMVKESLEKAKELGKNPEEYLGDTTFATGENLTYLEEEGVTAIMPTTTRLERENPAIREDITAPIPEESWDKLPKAGKIFAKDAFIYDRKKDEYRCPMGKSLSFLRESKRYGSLVRTYVSKNCETCPLANQCFKGKEKRRRINRDPYDDVRNRHAWMMLDEQNILKYKRRAPLVEVVFARIKGLLKIREFMTRGHDRVSLEWDWICTAYNLKLLISRQ